MNGSSPIPAIQIDELCKTYRGKRRRLVRALQDVSFEVREGEIFGFLGPNGAGKSTTIKSLMGLIRPTSGRVLLCGQSAVNVESRRNIGYLPENPAFYDFLSGRGYLRFVARAFGMPEQNAATAIDRALERLDLSESADRPLRGYSKGMVQRLGLAQTLIHDPQIYILDEPMSGLDPQGRALVKEIIVELGQRGKTVFFSTHITSDVEKICDRLAIICKGRLQLVASVDELHKESVQGYRLLAKGLENRPFGFGTQTELPTGEVEFLVSTGELVPLIEQIKDSDGTLELLEPCRRDLEQIFLDVVNKHAS